MNYTVDLVETKSKPLSEIIQMQKERISLLEEELERIANKNYVCCGLHEAIITGADRALSNKKGCC